MPDFSRTCVFCRIIRAGSFDKRYDLTARLPGLEVLSFIPLEPVTAGHRLFVPSLHVSTALDDPVLTGLVFETAARYAVSSMTDFNLVVNAGAAADQTVFHLHAHFVPRRAGDGLSLPWTKLGRDPAAPVPA